VRSTHGSVVATHRTGCRFSSQQWYRLENCDAHVRMAEKEEGRGSGLNTWFLREEGGGG
jgi:hypothetical protein